MKKLILTFAALISLCLSGCSHYGKSHEHKKSHHKHDQMWDKMDANKDGGVTKEEFDKAHSEMFTKMDADKDGKITKAEKKAFKKAMKAEKKSKKPCCQ